MKKFLKINYKKILILIFFYTVLFILDIKFNSNNPTFILSSYVDFPISIISYIFREICSGGSENSTCFNLLYPIKSLLAVLALLWRYIIVCFIYWIFSRLRQKNKKTP